MKIGNSNISSTRHVSTHLLHGINDLGQLDIIQFLQSLSPVQHMRFSSRESRSMNKYWNNIL